MFSFFKKKKTPQITIICKTDKVLINNQPLTFPTKYEKLIKILGEPSREIKKSKHYVFWDTIGVFCGYTDRNEIVSIHFIQIKKGKNNYTPKELFKGDLLLNNEAITNNEFSKISLGNIAVHRLGSENEIRYGFSIGVNNILNV